jgi:hypothetical protein
VGARVVGNIWNRLFSSRNQALAGIVVLLFSGDNGMMADVAPTSRDLGEARKNTKENCQIN